jgi:hypothetical protein
MTGSKICSHSHQTGIGKPDATIRIPGRVEHKSVTTQAIVNGNQLFFSLVVII